MNNWKANITNLKRQISRRSLCGTEREMNYLCAVRANFDVLELDESKLGQGPVYVLLCEGREVGKYNHFARTSQPDRELRTAWKMSGVRCPWEDEQ